MRNGTKALIGLLATIGLAGCDSNAVPVKRHPAVNAHAGIPSVRYQIDATRHRIWWLTRDGVFVQSADSHERTAVALPEWMWVDAAYSCLPDLALGPQGEAVITSNIQPVLWRVDPQTMAVSVHRLELNADRDKDVGFSGLTYSKAHEAYFGVSDLHGTLWRIDPGLTRAEKFATSSPIGNPCRIAIGGRLVPQESGRMVGLCVRGSRKQVTLDIVAPHRAAYVTYAPCTELPLE